MPTLGFSLVLSVLLVYLYRCLLSPIVAGVTNLWMKLPGAEKRNPKRFKVLFAVILSFSLFVPIVAVTGSGNAVGMANITAHLLFAGIMFLGIEREIPFFRKMVER